MSQTPSYDVEGKGYVDGASDFLRHIILVLDELRLESNFAIHDVARIVSWPCPLEAEETARGAHGSEEYGEAESAAATKIASAHRGRRGRCRTLTPKP